MEARKIKDQNPALYQAARHKLSQWRLTSTQIDQLEESETLQSSFDIVSEVSGVVTQRNISVGDFVNKGAVLFEIMELQQVWVLLELYENDLSSIRPGDKTVFKANAEPGQTCEGTVSFIEPLLDPQSRTLKIRAEA